MTVTSRPCRRIAGPSSGWAAPSRVSTCTRTSPVEENVAVGQANNRAAGSDDIAAVLEALRLTSLAERPVAELSQGQRQLVSIARALAGRPDVLLLDEPAAGLDTTESVWLATQLRTIRDTGLTILMVDHDMGLVLGLCDYIHVLDFGAVIASGTPEEIRTNPRVAEAYLGTSLTHGDDDLDVTLDNAIVEPAMAPVAATIAAPVDGSGG